MQDNVFVVTSTINTVFGLISPEERFLQTLDTIESIRRKDSTAKIVLVDNSNLQVEALHELSKMVDLCIDIGHRKICKTFNRYGIKGAGESYMLLVGLDAIKQSGLVPKRVFKISGRYKLSEGFDTHSYLNQIGSYCFKTRGKNEYDNTFLHTRMWSACGSLLDDMTSLVSKSLNTHLTEDITIEEALYKNINLTKLVEFDKIHCEGYIAPWNVLIED